MTFEELCKEARSSPDYMAIGESFISIIITGVPQMNLKRRDYMRRFILLIDTLYYLERNVVIEADVPLDQLFSVAGGLKAGEDTMGVDIHVLESLSD